MSTFYYRTRANVCIDVLQNEIIADPIIITPIEYIRLDNIVDLTFSFISPISIAEETQLDVVLAAHVCNRPDNSINNGADSSGESISLTNTNTGRIFQYSFYESDKAKNRWLQFADNVSSGETSAVIPWDCKLLAISYSNERNNSAIDLEIRKSLLNNGTSDILAYNWNILNSRTGINKNFTTDITFMTGDKIGIYFKETTNDYPKKPHVTLFFLITELDNLQQTIIEDYSGEFGSGSYDD